ncbi:hypothetical protein EJB05_04071 [Eragrostis curvula]|uniref:Uncharacterized protein n=1 Tax=Eragrostis curvula TaxID=38414 RepID=A0A5J9W9P8_9POAL|nr:hypothetical protein EJB05_04071 [Eragrostis curvula]
MRYKEASEHVHGRTSGEALNWTLGSCWLVKFPCIIVLMGFSLSVDCTNFGFGNIL